MVQQEELDLHPRRHMRMEQLFKEQHQLLRIHCQADQQVPIMYLAMAMEMAAVVWLLLSPPSARQPSKWESPHRCMHFKNWTVNPSAKNGLPLQNAPPGSYRSSYRPR